MIDHTRRAGNSLLGWDVLDPEMTDRPDHVLFWSTKLTAAEFADQCTHFRHAPGNLRNVELVADDRFLTVDTLAALADAVRDARHVRFNTGDWSVQWLRGDHGQPNEIQAFVGKVPAVMAQMLCDSVIGFSASDVGEMLSELAG